MSRREAHRHLQLALSHVRKASEMLAESTPTRGETRGQMSVRLPRKIERLLPARRRGRWWPLVVARALDSGELAADIHDYTDDAGRVMVTLYLPRAVGAQMDRDAAKRGVTRTEWLCRAVARWAAEV